MQQCVSEFVQERHREVGLILSVLHFDERLERMRTPLGADTFRSPMLPLVGRNDPDVDAYYAEFDSTETSASTAVVEAIASIRHCEPTELEPLYNSVDSDALDAIAEVHDASRYQIALAWLLQHSPVTLPIPGTSSVTHLKENVAASAIELSDDELARLR